MGAAAAIGGGLLLGGLAGKKATAPQQTSTSVQQASSEPWIGAQPGLSTLYNSAVENFNSGVPQYYPGQTLADQSWNTLAGQNFMAGRGMAGNQFMGGANALDAAQYGNTLTSQGGYLWGDPTRAALAEDSNFDANAMRGMNSVNQFGGGGMIGRTAGMPELGAIGRGAMLGGNPYVDAMFNQAADRAGEAFSKYTMPGVESAFAGAGRYGSEAMNQAMSTQQKNFGQQLNDLATQIYGGNYANERGLLQQALNTQAQTGLGERQQQLGALGLQTGNQLQGQQLQLANLGLLSNQYQDERNRMMQANGMAPELSQADYTDINAMLGAGGMQDARSQSVIDDARQRFDYYANANNNRLSFLASLMQGAPMQSQSSGQSSGMMPGNPMAPLQGALMGGMLGSGIAGMIPQSSPYMYSAPRVGMF